MKQPSTMLSKRAWLTQRWLRRCCAPPLRFTYWLSGRLLRGMYPEWGPRSWSSQELRRFAPLFSGEVVNVSGWQDADKEGSSYRQYFTNKCGYFVTNLGKGQRGDTMAEDIPLDLIQELPAALRGRFDVVLNHTVLEHIYEARKAMANLCAMSRDVVIVVVPWVQAMHWHEGDYGDYWRFSPMALQEMFQENGLTLMYYSYNDVALQPVYIFAIASKQPAKWQGQFPELPPVVWQQRSPGRSLQTFKLPKGPTGLVR